MDDNFLTYINQDDDLQIAIRCHLVIEYYLMKLVEYGFPVKNEFDIDRLNFKQKVELAISLGCVDKRRKGLFLCINKLRNKFAHDINHKVTDKEIAEMHSMLESNEKENLTQTAYQDANNARKLGGIYLVLYAYLKIRQEIIEENT